MFYILYLHHRGRSPPSQTAAYWPRTCLTPVRVYKPGRYCLFKFKLNLRMLEILEIAIKGDEVGNVMDKNLAA